MLEIESARHLGQPRYMAGCPRRHAINEATHARDRICPSPWAASIHGRLPTVTWQEIFTGSRLARDQGIVIIIIFWTWRERALRVRTHTCKELGGESGYCDALFGFLLAVQNWFGIGEYLYILDKSGSLIRPNYFHISVLSI